MERCLLNLRNLWSWPFLLGDGCLGNHEGQHFRQPSVPLCRRAPQARPLELTSGRQAVGRTDRGLLQRGSQGILRLRRFPATNRPSSSGTLLQNASVLPRPLPYQDPGFGGFDSSGSPENQGRAADLYHSTRRRKPQTARGGSEVRVRTAIVQLLTRPPPPHQVKSLERGGMPRNFALRGGARVARLGTEAGTTLTWRAGTQLCTAPAYKAAKADVGLPYDLCTCILREKSERDAMSKCNVR